MHQSLDYSTWPPVPLPRPARPSPGVRRAPAASARQRPAASVRPATRLCRLGDVLGVAGGVVLVAVLGLGGQVALTAAIAAAAFLYLGFAVAGVRRGWVAWAALAATATLALASVLPAAAAGVGLAWGAGTLLRMRPLAAALRVTLPAWCAFHAAAAFTALLL